MTDKPRSFWSSDRLLSFTAILISLLTFIVFLYQTQLIRQQQYMSVYPYLSMGNIGSQTKDYRFILENKGIGPAILQSVKLTTADKKEFTDIAPFVQTRLADNDTINFFHANLSSGRLISPNELIEIIGTSDRKVSTSNLLYEVMNKEGVKIEIIYQSIYGETWKITLDKDFPIAM